MRYRRYGDDLLLLEQFASSAVEVAPTKRPSAPALSVGGHDDVKPRQGEAFTGTGGWPKSLDRLELCSPELRDCYETLRSYALSLGDGVHEHIIDKYIAFRGLKNFAYVHFRPTQTRIKIHVNVDDATPAAESGFVREPGRKGGFAELDIVGAEDVERTLPLIAQSYRRT